VHPDRAHAREDAALSDEIETTGAPPPARRPFGMRRRNFVILRVVLVAGILVLGFTLHHRGTAYVVIRAAYLVIVVGLLVWRIGNRRGRRSRRRNSQRNT
jgi:hypothetical protein